MLFMVFPLKISYFLLISVCCHIAKRICIVDFVFALKPFNGVAREKFVFYLCSIKSYQYGNSN